MAMETPVSLLLCLFLFRTLAPVIIPAQPMRLRRCFLFPCPSPSYFIIRQAALSNLFNLLFPGWQRAILWLHSTYPPYKGRAL